MYTYLEAHSVYFKSYYMFEILLNSINGLIGGYSAVVNLIWSYISRELPWINVKFWSQYIDE